MDPTTAKWEINEAIMKGQLSSLLMLQSQQETVVGDNSTNKINATVCSEIVILLPLKYLIQTRGPGLQSLWVSCHLQTYFGVSNSDKTPIRWTQSTISQVDEYAQSVCNNTVIICAHPDSEWPAGHHNYL